MGPEAAVMLAHPSRPPALTPTLSQRERAKNLPTPTCSLPSASYAKVSRGGEA